MPVLRKGPTNRSLIVLFSTISAAAAVTVAAFFTVDQKEIHQVSDNVLQHQYPSSLSSSTQLGEQTQVLGVSEKIELAETSVNDRSHYSDERAVSVQQPSDNVNHLLYGFVKPSVSVEAKASQAHLPNLKASFSIKESLSKQERQAIHQQINDVIQSKQQNSTAHNNLSPIIAQMLLKTLSEEAQDQVASIELLESAKLVMRDERGYLAVTLRLHTFSEASLRDLEQQGVEILRQHEPSKTIEGYLDPALLSRLAEHKSVANLSTTLPPTMSAGSTLTEGDESLLTNMARETLGVTGAGSKVCVLSDGVLGLQEAALSGDIPADPSGQPAVEFCAVNAADQNSGAEGTAMLEIIHDLAPGAELAFCSGYGGQLGILEAINYFSHPKPEGAGCDIIVDDLKLYNEPYFQDGLLAEAATAAVERGVMYLSAAGNDASRHYQSRFNGVHTQHLGQRFFLHDFSASADPQVPANNYLIAALEPGASITFNLQWADPFGGSSSDMDLILVPSPFTNGNYVISNGATVQDGDDNPEEIGFIHNGAEVIQQFYIMIAGYSADVANRPLKLFARNNGGGAVYHPDFYVPQGSLVGQSAAKGVISVGAINAGDEGLDDIATYSSQGPTSIFFDTLSRGGAPLETPELRLTPTVTGVDTVQVTGFGGFASPFVGTSAAAPHIAAVVALMLEQGKNGGVVLTPAQIEEQLRATSRDRGVEGVDTVYGAGLVDAYAAVNAIAEIAPPLPPVINPFNELNSTLKAAILLARTIDVEHYKNPRSQERVLRFLTRSFKDVLVGKYDRAHRRLSRKLSRLDGCLESDSGEADKRDYIHQCEAQLEMYELVSRAIEWIDEVREMRVAENHAL